ncbi:MAG: Hint domain-containing protein [Pseudomonadota bacterium]
MAYNIVDVSGNGTETAPDDWTFEGDLSDPGVEIVSGDFDPFFFIFPADEADTTYTYSPLSTTQWGSLIEADPDTGVFQFDIDRDAVIASGSDQSVTFTITGTTTGGSTATDTVTIDILICIARGTLVETAEGLRVVESLRTGDMVLTHGRGAQPVRWIGSRVLGRDALQATPALAPVRIDEGALAPGVPDRPLWVSPQHRVLISGWRAELMFGEDDVLVPAKSLVNGRTIHLEAAAEEVEYFHLLFERHEIIRTNGALTESLYPGPIGLDGVPPEARDELLLLFPELADARLATVRTCPRAREARALGALL